VKATRVIAAIVGTFVVVVIGLWIRHHLREERQKAHLAEIVADARWEDAQRIAVLKKYFEPRDAGAAGGYGTTGARRCAWPRSRIVRLSSVEAPGARLGEVLKAVSEGREPEDLLHDELDVVDGIAFLYDYGQRRIVCLGFDREDPHGTLVAH
jgi:hypothetical protein